MADTVPQTGGVKDIAFLLASLGPLFSPGDSHTSSTKTLSPEAEAQANELIQKLFGNLSPENLDALVANTLDRAKQSFAPGNILSAGAGLRGYSDTVASSLKNEAMARATAESMSVRLDAFNKAGSTAAGLIQSKMQNTGSTDSQTSKDDSDLGTALKYALPAAFLYDKWDKLGPSDGFSFSAPFNMFSNDAPTDIIPGSGDGLGGINDLSGGNMDTGGFDDNILNGINLAGAISAPAAPAPPLDSNVPLDVDGNDLTDQDWLDSIDAGGGLTDDLVDFFDGGLIGKKKPPLGRVTNIKKVKGYADGGRIQPGSYTTDALQNAIQRRTIQSPQLHDEPKAAVAPAPKRTRDNSSSDVGNDDLSDSQDTSGLASGPFSGTPGFIGMGIAGAHALIGDLPGAVMALAKSAAVNQAIGQFFSNSSPDLGDGAMAALANADSGISGPGMLGVATGNDDLGGAGFVSSGDQTAGEGNFGSDAPDGGDGAGDGGAGDGGGSGDGGGGDGFADGKKIKAKNKVEASGIDKVQIHATPGEYMLPVDTTEILGEDFLDSIVAATHTPLRKAA